MKKTRSLSGYRFWHCDTVAGADGGAGGDGAGGQGGQGGQSTEELLKNLDLKQEEIEALKTNKSLLDVVVHQIKAKREANADAKKHREKLEAIEAENKKKEEEALKKKGDFETLLKNQEEKEKKNNEKIRSLLVQKELISLSAQYGLKNPDYLKLMDVSDAEVDLEQLTVSGLKGKFESFKEKYPDFFGEPTNVPVDGGKPTRRGGSLESEDEELKALEDKAKKTRLPRDLAAWRKRKLEIDKSRKK